jgi:hypothetical protein
MKSNEQAVTHQRAISFSITFQPPAQSRRAWAHRSLKNLRPLYMQDQVDLLLQAFAKLREEVEQLQESRLQIEAISTGESARGMALSSIVAEIAEHLGRPEAAIREAFEIRHRHFHQELLQLA